MLSTRDVHFLTKPLVPAMGNLLHVVGLKNTTVSPNIKQAKQTNNYLLKTTHTLETELGRVELDLTWKPSLALTHSEDAT